MYITPTNEKEDVNLKKSKKEYRKQFGGRKERKIT